MQAADAHGSNFYTILVRVWCRPHVYHSNSNWPNFYPTLGLCLLLKHIESSGPRSPRAQQTCQQNARRAGQLNYFSAAAGRHERDCLKPETRTKLTSASSGRLLRLGVALRTPFRVLAKLRKRGRWEILLHSQGLSPGRSPGAPRVVRGALTRSHEIT